MQDPLILTDVFSCSTNKWCKRICGIHQFTWTSELHVYKPSHRGETSVWLPVFVPSDVPPLVDSVFLELSGLDRDLPLRLHLCADGSWLPGVHVCVHIQTSAARHLAENTVPGAAGLPQGERERQYYSVCYIQYIFSTRIYFTARLSWRWFCVSKSVVSM